jgi:transcription elongation factor Elf1
MAKQSVTVKQGDTRILATCGKCGAPNKTRAPKGTARVKYTLREIRAQAGDAVRRQGDYG